MKPVPVDVDHQHALTQYRLRAQAYDGELVAFEPIRCAAITRLDVAAGATVLDVGCGTGLSFAPLLRAVGPTGQIIGIEQSPDMLELARARVAQQTWPNVTLLNAAAEVSQIQVKADAALFHFTHDILRSPDAVLQVMQALKPGAHVVAAGLQWSAPWAWATNWCVMMAAMYSVTSLDGLNQPWSILAEHLEQLEVSTTLMGSVYIAYGVKA
jgi:ubiquinone/menaquinone biosynthesis C-methylase UbiE